MKKINLKNLFKRKQKKKAEGTQSNKLTVNILLGILSIIIISEISYFGYHFYKKYTEVSELQELIEKNKGAVAILSKMKEGGTKVSDEEKKLLESKHANKVLIEDSLKTTKLEIIEKFDKKGEEYKYFTAKLYYNAKDLDAVKDLVAHKYISDSVLKILSVNKDYIELVLQEKK